jgi:O-antigen/teichoic acid export membrane protein/glycosyltransferase involved in cell wall biosynthesis
MSHGPVKQNQRSHWPISILSSLSAVINMGIPLILVRMLGADEVGRFKIFFLYLAAIPAFSLSLGIVNGLSYWSGRREAKTGETAESEKHANPAVAASGIWLLILGCLITAIGLVFQRDLSAWLGWPESQIRMLAWASSAAISSSYFEESAIASGRIWSGAIFNAVWEAIRTLSILAAAVITRDLPFVFFAHTVCVCMKTVVGYGLAGATGQLDGWKESFRFSKWNQGIFKYAFPVSLAAAFGIFANYADQMILSATLTPAHYALYAMGCLTVPPLLILEYSVARVLIPQLSEDFSHGRNQTAAFRYRKAVEELAYLMIPAVTGMFIFAEPIVRMLFTERFIEAAGFLRIFAFSYLLLCIPYDSVARAQGKASWILGNFVGFSVLTVLICGGLTWKFGPVGALAGMLISKTAMRTYSLSWIRRQTGWKIGDFLPVKSVPFYILVSAALGLAALAAKPFFALPSTWFVLTGSLFSLLYFVLTLSRKFESIESRRVLILSQYIGIGGLERMVFNLSSTLKKETNWEPRVFVFDHDPAVPNSSTLLSAFEEAGIPIETYPKKKGFSFKTVKRIAQSTREFQIGVIHSHDLGALIYGVAAKILSLFQGRKIRLVHTQHSFVHLGRKRRYTLYERFFTLFADELTVVSEGVRSGYQQIGVPHERIRVITNGVSFPISRSEGFWKERPMNRLENRRRKIRELSSREYSKTMPAEIAESISSFVREVSAHDLASENWLLYLARLHPGKGQEHALEVWSKLPEEERQRSRLLYVGPESSTGLGKELMEKISSSPQSERIHYLGASQKPESWIQISDVFLSCSESEGMPLGPIEAAGAGIPLFLSGIEGHRILSKCSISYALEESSRGAEVLSRLLKNLRREPDTVLEKQWERTESIRHNFSLSAMTDRYKKLYEGSQPPMAGKTRLTAYETVCNSHL